MNREARQFLAQSRFVQFWTVALSRAPSVVLGGIDHFAVLDLCTLERTKRTFISHSGYNNTVTCTWRRRSNVCAQRFQKLEILGVSLRGCADSECRLYHRRHPARDNPSAADHRRVFAD